VRRTEGGLVGALSRQSGGPLTSEHILSLLFTSNFIGVVFARSLHFQFYSWYFHTLPHLLFSTDLPWFVNVGLMAGIEVIWNIFPPTPWASALLQAFHWIILIALFFATPKPAFYSTKMKATSVDGSGAGTTKNTSSSSSSESRASNASEPKKLSSQGNNKKKLKAN